MIEIASNEILNEVFKDQNEVELSELSSEHLTSIISIASKELKRREKEMGWSTKGGGNYKLDE